MVDVPDSSSISDTDTVPTPASLPTPAFVPTPAPAPAPAPAHALALVPSSDPTPIVENTYNIRPNYQHKFKIATVKDRIHTILKDQLTNRLYNPDEIPQLTKFLSETIKDHLKELGYERYKMVVQVVIGEQRGEGVKMAARCFWDLDTDNYVQDVFINDSLFCVAVAFGCFYY